VARQIPAATDMSADAPLRLYRELAVWWPLFSPPEHYAEEAADLLPALHAAADAPQTMLELGSGGGSLACHLKRAFQLTLSDRSSDMLAVSRAINPECEHVLGDMRTLDLGRTFDIVFIHDAIMYAIDAPSVRATLRTAARHCRPGGAVVVVPDEVRETYEPGTSHGGEDGAGGRALRYLEWSWDPDPSDDTTETAWVFMLRDESGAIHVDRDRHQFGLFARDAWFGWLAEAGFSATSRIDPWNRDVFVGRKM
jgi:SAM-dependent methyltransferase